MSGPAGRAVVLEEERIVPGTPYWDASYPDHIQRYRLALEYVRDGALVLDAGCGVGYGAAEIADGCRANVVAVDRSDDALDLARRHFDRAAIRWCIDDCETLEQAARLGPFDVIVNFENIEHLERPDRFVARAAALLRPDGVLIASTPNRLLINRLRGVPPAARSANPHHPSELSEPEFRSLLERHFGSVQILYQSPVGAERRRILLRSWLARLGLLSAVRSLRRHVGARRAEPPPSGHAANRRWVIQQRDHGTAWTLIAVCRAPRT